MNTITINVEGMSCGHCVKGVTNALNELEGIQTVLVSLENKTAVVDYDSDKIAIEKIIAAIQEEGYQASL